MGHQTAIDMTTSGLSLDAQLRYHLTANHYPPVPTSMVATCIEAVEAYNDEDPDRLITLPFGILWRGLTAAPAKTIIEAHHLDAWLVDWED